MDSMASSSSTSISGPSEPSPEPSLRGQSLSFNPVGRAMLPDAVIAVENEVGCRVAADRIHMRTLTSPVRDSNSLSRHLNEARGMAIMHRFALIQSTLLYLLVHTIARRHESRLYARDRTDTSISGQHQPFRPLTRAMLMDIEEKLSEFDGVVKRHKFIVLSRPQPPPHDETWCDWLQNGPSIEDNFRDPSWIPYFLTVKRLLSDPASNRWLNHTVGAFFDNVGEGPEENILDSQTPGSRGSLPGRARDRDLRRSSDVEEARILNLADNIPRQDPSAWSVTLLWVFDKLFAPLATAVCILNITAALGYVMLMNDPAPPKRPYTIGTIITWFLTSGMMICYGILSTGSMKDYARHLVILAMFVCFVVAVVFHFAGASNFASSFPVGITMAVLLIQIW